MTDDVTPSWLPGLGFDFIHRVYRTSALLALFAGVLLWERFGVPMALGWFVGAGLSLGVLRSAEWSVRRFVRPGDGSMRPILWLTVGKMLAIVLLLLLAAIGARRGWVNLFGMAAGFPLPGLVLVLKLVGKRLSETVQRMN